MHLYNTMMGSYLLFFFPSTSMLRPGAVAQGAMLDVEPRENHERLNSKSIRNAIKSNILFSNSSNACFKKGLASLLAVQVHLNIAQRSVGVNGTKTVISCIYIFGVGTIYC